MADENTPTSPANPTSFVHLNSETSTSSASGGVMRVVVLVLLLALAAVGAYSMRQRSTASKLAAQNEQIAASLNQTQAQIEAMNAKIAALSTPPPALQAAPAARPHAASAKRSAARPHRDDPRWKQFQAKLDEQNKALAEQGMAIDKTRADLDSTKTELSGNIARTHDELVLLQKKGERNYYEFDLDKSKQFRAQGPVSMKLKKANTKRQFADLELIVDDATLQQKHVNLYQPVMFYAADSGMPVELVINRISKDHIHGYVSEPKYKRSELTASSGANANGATQTANAASLPPERRKLALPK